MRSNLSKCALMLVKEVFLVGVQSEGPDSRLSGFVKLVLPTALVKTVFEKHFIALEARKALD